jgi:hypothetical protein
MEKPRSKAMKFTLNHPALNLGLKARVLPPEVWHGVKV